MKFSCEKLMLQTALLTSARAASAKSPVPALEGLHLLTEEGSVTITGYDLKLGIITKIEADIEEAGSIVLNARLLCDIIRKLPGDFVTISAANGYVTKITCDMSEFELLGSPASDYPDLPSVESELSFQMGETDLKQMINQTNFAVSDNESRLIHTGALFDIKDSVLTIVAVDGYRMAIRREAIENDITPCSFVIPGTALSEVEKIIPDNEKDIRILVGEKHVMFLIGDTMLLTRRLEGDFINYENSVPRDNKYKLTIPRKTLIDAVERVSLIINDKTKSPLHLTFSDNVIRLNTSSSLGKASDECHVDGFCDDVEVGFNNKYILDALKAAPTDEIIFELTTGSSPCVITPPDGSDKYLYMVLPVRLKDYEN